MARLRSLLLWVVLPALLAVAAGYALHAHTTPVFSAAVLGKVAAKARELYPPGSPRALENSVEFISAELAQIYPRHIHPNDQWVTNLAGGFKTAMLILHASMTEYVMIWGSQVATTGHSGRNLAEFHDFIISDQGTWWKEGGLALETAGASPNGTSYMYTPRLSGGILQLQPGTFMLEWCHGVIPALLPFGLGDALFSSMDPVTIWRSLYAYGRLTIKELIENGKI